MMTERATCKHENLMRHDYHGETWWQCEDGCDFVFRLAAPAEAAPIPISFGVPTIEVSNEASPGVVMSPPVTFSPSGNRTFVDGKEVFLKDTVRMSVTRSQSEDTREALLKICAEQARAALKGARK